MAGVQAFRNLYKLYVGNIPWTVGNNELKKYFSKFGHLNSVAVVFDKNTGLSKNYGFIIFSNREGHESALNATHRLEGHTLKVEPASNATS